MKIVTLLLDQKLSLEVWVEEQGKEQTPSASNDSSIFRSRLIFYTPNQLDAFYVKCTYLFLQSRQQRQISPFCGPYRPVVLRRHCPMKRQWNNWQIATIALVYCVFFTDVFIDIFFILHSYIISGTSLSCAFLVNIFELRTLIHQNLMLHMNLFKKTFYCSVILA